MARKQLTNEADAAEVTQPLHVKYRPKHLDEVIGHKTVIKSLQDAIKAKARAHCFLFTGPGGTGKTTLARIMGDAFDCGSVIEVDAASNSGIDEMKKVTETLRYNGMGDRPNKAIIIDECQRLSPQAWDSLLKITEEPPPHVFFFFCSTNPAKIPKPMMTRCLGYDLKPVKLDDLVDLMDAVCEKEKLDTPEKFLVRIAQACEGSPRQALTMLAKVANCETLDEVDLLLEVMGDNAEVIDLARAMVRGDLNWNKMTATLKDLNEAGLAAESIRIVIVNYLNACLMGNQGEKGTIRLLDMLECFLKPCNTPDKMGPLLVAFGRYIYA